MTLAPLMPEQWDALHWMLAIVAAICIGLSKTGFGGVGTLFVLIMASVMPARESTGFILPMLLFADVFAVRAFRQHADWSHIKRLIPATYIGIVVGYFAMSRIPDTLFRPVIGWIVLLLCVLQLVRSWREEWFSRLPHSQPFSNTMGLSCGLTSMMANNAGPVASFYMLASGLPKMDLVGTSAWFFLLVNAFKVPFSYSQGLINFSSLAWNILLCPAVLVGVFGGKWLLARIPQKQFEWLLLIFSFIAALRLIM